jgi:flagellar protein FliO/FliZ
MVLVLALVLVGIWLVFRFLKKASRPKGSSESEIKVFASTSLGQGKAVHLVGLGDKAWLVGTAESSVSLIAQVEDKELVDRLSLEAATQAAKPKADFSSLLGSLMGKKPRPGAGEPPSEGLDPDFLARQRDRLKKL